MHEFRREGKHGGDRFVPIHVTPDKAKDRVLSSQPVGEIQIECVRDQSKVTIRWPISASADCAAWIKDWLA